MQSQHRLQVTRRTTWNGLLAQIEERAGETFLIVGVGARARRLLDRLHRELPNVDRPWSLDGREHVAFIGDSMRDIAWGHDQPGKPPVVEVEGPDGVVR